MQYLDLQEILQLHFKVIKDFGGSHGVRDEGRLRSVVNAPHQSIFGEDQYKTVYDKAAVYMRNIIADHPFFDGNKRSGVTVALIFLRRNKVLLAASPKELEDFAVSVAVDHLEIDEIAQWLEKNTKK